MLSCICSYPEVAPSVESDPLLESEGLSWSRLVCFLLVHPKSGAQPARDGGCRNNRFRSEGYESTPQCRKVARHSSNSTRKGRESGFHWFSLNFYPLNRVG